MFRSIRLSLLDQRTGTAQNAGDLDELDGLLRGIHFDGLFGSSVSAVIGVFAAGGRRQLLT